MAATRLATRSFLLLIAGQFLQALGFSSMILLPLYLHHLGASHAEIGAIMAAASVGGLACRPLVGWSLDRLGRRPTVAAGIVLLAASMGLLYGVEALGPLVYADRVLFGVGKGILFTGYFTWAADLVPQSRRTEGLALFGIFGLLPIGLNAFVADLGVEPGRLPLLFTVLGGIVLASLAVPLLLPEPPREAGTAEDRAVSVWGGLARAELAPVWLATCAFASLVALFFAFATVTAEGRGVGPAALWLPYAGGAIGVRLVGARLPDRLGPANLLAPALGSYTAALVVASRATDPEGFLLAGLLAGFGHGYCFPVLTGQVVTRAPPQWRGSALSAFSALWEVAELGVPPVLGLVADRLGEATMYAGAAVGALVALCGWAVLEHVLGGPRRASWAKGHAASEPRA